jgi:hypothetical protein
LKKRIVKQIKKQLQVSVHKKVFKEIEMESAVNVRNRWEFTAATKGYNREWTERNISDHLGERKGRSQQVSPQRGANETSEVTETSAVY